MQATYTHPIVKTVSASPEWLKWRHQIWYNSLGRCKLPIHTQLSKWCRHLPRAWLLLKIKFTCSDSFTTWDCSHGSWWNEMALVTQEMYSWLSFDTREMSRWFGFGFSGHVSQHGSVLVPRETLVCVSTHYLVETFTGVYSGDVKMICFWFLGRC